MIDPVMVALRIVHILSGIVWVGSTIFIHLILLPSLRAEGPRAEAPVMRRINAFIIHPIMGLSALLVVASGVTMALRLRSGVLDLFLVTPWGWAILIGFIAAMLAMIPPSAALATMRRFTRAATTLEYGGGTAEDEREYRRARDVFRRFGVVESALLIVAVVAMAAARWV